MKKNKNLTKSGAASFVFLFVFSIAILSCGKPSNAVPPPQEEIFIDTSYSRMVCGLKNPLNDLPWLKDIMTGKSKPAGNIGSLTWIYAYKFKGADVIYLLNTPSSYNPWIVFNCAGIQIIPFIAPNEKWEEFKAERTDELLLWKSN